MKETKNDNDFGRLVRGERKRKEFSQRTLAEMVGVDHTYISRIENGLEPSPSEELVHALGRAFGFARYPRLEMVILSGRIPTEFKNVILNDEEAAKGLFARLLKSEAQEREQKEQKLPVDSRA